MEQYSLEVFDNKVVSHLLFHKSLEESDTSQINHYLELAKNLEESDSSGLTNPVDKNIHLVFSSVFRGDLDPWDIDLVNFTSLYLSHAKNDSEFDLITAGRIIHMAWRVLALQSTHLAERVEQSGFDDSSSEFDSGWDELPFASWDELDEMSATHLMLQSETPALDPPPIRREGKRRITLMELLSAFEEARKETQRFQLIDGLRRKEKDELLTRAHLRMTGAAHEDHLEEDIASVWKKICGSQKSSHSISELHNKGDHDGRVRVFLSILFLAMEGKISIRQRRFPYGQIMIKRLNS